MDVAIRAYKVYLAERSTEYASTINHVASDNVEGDSILSESDGMQPCLFARFVKNNLKLLKVFLLLI